MLLKVSTIFIFCILFLLSILLLIPVIILFIECIFALLPDHKLRNSSNNQIGKPRIAVLVPAHNENLVINQTLSTLFPELSDQDRLIVIADNCTDNTAELARNLGATVIERNSLAQVGKGYALDFGLRFLKTNPSNLPEVVIVIDADCIVLPNSISRIAAEAVKSQRPVQALYLMKQEISSNPKSLISVLAFTIKNLVRPIGLAKLGFSCLLTGTGMAFPWSIIGNVSLANDNLVEDMQLGIDFAIAGYPPLFVKQAKVIGLLPQQEKAAKSQKMRWIHGHLQTIRTQVPRLFQAAWKQKRLDLAMIALDICVPPLSLLVFSWFVVLCSGLILGVTFQQWLISILALFEGALIFSAIVGAWLKFARQDIPFQTLLKTPIYILWKIPILLAFWRKRQVKWIRTERDIIAPQFSNSD